MNENKNRKSCRIAGIAMLALFFVSANAFANLPGPPWLDFGSNFSWDGTTISSTLGQPVVSSLTYVDGSTAPPPPFPALADSILYQHVNFSLSFDSVANDTISIGNFFSADLIEGAAFNPAVNGSWEIGLANIVLDATNNGAAPFNSRWVEEFALTSNQHLIFNSFGMAGDLVNATGKLVPAPSVLLLLGTGLIGLIVVTRRKDTFLGSAV